MIKFDAAFWLYDIGYFTNTWANELASRRGTKVPDESDYKQWPMCLFDSESEMARVECNRRYSPKPLPDGLYYENML